VGVNPHTFTGHLAPAPISSRTYMRVAINYKNEVRARELPANTSFEDAKRIAHEMLHDLIGDKPFTLGKWNGDGYFSVRLDEE